MAVPSFDGKGDSFQEYAAAVEKWRRVASLEARKLAPALVFQTEANAREVRMTFGADKQPERDGFVAMLTALKNYYAPGSMDVVYREVAHYSNSRNPAQVADKFRVKFDLLRREAEGRMREGETSPDAAAAET